MGKRKRKKSVYLKLVKEFDAVFPQSFLFTDTSPDITRIKKILEKNKIKPYSYKALSNFFDYIINRTIFFIGGKINNLFISDKPKKVLESLLKELTILIQVHQDKPADSNNKTIIDLTYLITALGLSVKNGIKGSISKSGQLFYSFVNNPVYSLKKFSLFGIYALAGQPVAGLYLSQTSPNTRYIHNLSSCQESEWFKFFDYVEAMLEEYNDYPIDEKDKRLFFKFLEIAFSGDSASALSDESKKRLFRITQYELSNQRYRFNDIDDLKMLYALFNVFLRIEYSDADAKEILVLVSQYAGAIAENNIVLDKKIENLDWHFTNFFWVLNVNFNKYAKNLPRLDEFTIYFEPLQKMNSDIYRWDKDSIFSFRTVLSIYRRLRVTFAEKAPICNYLDTFAQQYVTETLNLVQHQCFSLTEDEIKESAYIEYVRKLPSNKQPLFAGVYKEVTKEQIFSNSYPYQIPNAFKIDISYQQMTDIEKSIVNKAILNTYNRVEALKTKLGIRNKNNKKSLLDNIFRLHIFKTKAAYVKYGPLWGVNTAGGGYAQIRSPSENELPINSYRERRKGDSWFETFIYQQEGDTRNNESKEGGSFRNLGHEIQHALFYALIGHQELHNLPSWMIEGGANALGNEACFKEEADYIKRFKDKLPNIERIINMRYASGDDLYYFGSALFRFMLEKHPDKLSKIILAARNGTKLNEVNKFIKDSLIPLSDEFSQWLTKSINDCSAKEQESETRKKNTEDSTQTVYRQDLHNNPDLLQLIRQQAPIEFTFSDTVFVLRDTNISRYKIEEMTGKKTEFPVSVGDYQWFKSALEIYIIKNKLQPFKLTEKNENLIIQKLLNKEEHDVLNRYILRINRPQDEHFKSVFEGFVFEKSFGLSVALKNCFIQRGEEMNGQALQRIIDQEAVKNDIPIVSLGYTTSTTSNPSAIVVAAATLTFFNFTTSSRHPSLTSHPSDADEQNASSWQLPVLVTVASLTSLVMLGAGLYCFFNRKKIDLLMTHRNNIVDLENGSNTEMDRFIQPTLESAQTDFITKFTELKEILKCERGSKPYKGILNEIDAIDVVVSLKNFRATSQIFHPLPQKFNKIEADFKKLKLKPKKALQLKFDEVKKSFTEWKSLVDSNNASSLSPSFN